MEIIKNICNCPYCKGAKVVPPQDKKYIITGGRHPTLIILDEGEDYVWHSANKVGTNIGVPEGAEIIMRIPASVHGCFKIVKNQEVVVYKCKT